MSGKAARRLRKSRKFSKKSLALCAGLCIGSVSMVADGEFLISMYPHFTKPVGDAHNIEYGIGGGIKMTYRPIDFLNIFLKGDYLSLALPGVDPITLLDASVGGGYHLGITDRLAFDVNLNIGAYRANTEKNITAISAGGDITFTYKLNPIVYADVNASASHYASGSSPLMILNTALSPGLTINLSEIFKNSAKVHMDDYELVPVFPVLYSWYENNSFGKVNITNNENSSITDVTVSFYQPQYMAHPKQCAKFSRLGKDESVQVDLLAFFNEQMLELTEKTDSQAMVTVDYSCLGQKRSKTFALTVPVYGRNNMSWDDDRRAAVFVSSKDPAAMLFAKYVTSIVRDNVRSGVPLNIQYAMGIFEVLDQFGLNYVVDPSSAFEDNVGTSSIDFLQFPYQTLMYRGGDCDDLSILVCSLFEAVGIRTSFITIPGHIFMAFDSGLSTAQAMDQFTSVDELIVLDNEVWVPLEITLTDEGFNKAWRVGAREWNNAEKNGTAAIYKMSDSWKTYQPISVPGATAYFTMPDNQIIAKLFDHSIDQWISREIEPQIQMYEAQLAKKDDVKVRNRLGVLYGKYGLFVQADNQFKQARRKGYTPSIINTGNVYYSRQNYELAQKWYESVLDKEPDNAVALIGVARCAYELADYDNCDKNYAKAMEIDPELAGEYSYLGSFVNSKGRAFSLADRLSNTVWLEEKDEVPVKLQNTFKEEVTDSPVIEENPLSDDALADILALANQTVAVVPETHSEEKDDSEEQGTEGGDDGDDSSAFAANVAPEELDISSFTENFNGLASEVNLSEINAKELDNVPQEKIEQPVVKKPVTVVKKAVTAEKPVEKAAAETAPVAVVEPAAAETVPVAVVEPAAAETAPVAVVEPAAAEPAPVAVVEPAAAEPAPVAVVEPAAVEPAPVAVIEPAAAETAPVAAVEPAPVAVVEPAAAETAPVAVVEPAAVETAPVAVVEPAAAETAPAAVVEPAAVEPTPAAVVEPAAAEPAPVAVVEPAAAEVEQIAAVEPAAAETAPVAVAEPAAAETAPVAVVEPAAVESTPVAAAEPAAAEVEQIAAVEPAAAEPAPVAVVEPAAVEPAPVAVVEPAAAEPAPVAVVEPAAAETAPVAAAEPAAAEPTPVAIAEEEVPELFDEYELDPEEFDLDDYMIEDNYVTEADLFEETESAETEPAETETTEEKSIFQPLVQVAEVEANTESEPEIEKMEVPRFTEQPSAEWAPEAAYVAETIPGMKSFEEEMGEYQNDKSFLYQEDKTLSVDPDHDVDVVEEIKPNSEQLALAGLPDVDPFSSYLSAEDAKAVSKITNYSIKEVRREAEKKVAASVEKVAETVAEVVTEKTAEVVTELVTDAVKDAVSESVPQSITNAVKEEITNISSGENTKKKIGGIAALIAVVAAAGGGAYAVSKSKKKKGKK